MGYPLDLSKIAQLVPKPHRLISVSNILNGNIELVFLQRNVWQRQTFFKKQKENCIWTLNRKYFSQAFIIANKSLRRDTTSLFVMKMLLAFEWGTIWPVCGSEKVNWREILQWLGTSIFFLFLRFFTLQYLPWIFWQCRK